MKARFERTRAKGFVWTRAVAFLIACTCTALDAHPAPGRSNATPSLPELPLSPLPKPPRVEVASPKPDELAELDAHLKLIRSAEPETRKQAIEDILLVEPRRIPAIHRRITLLAENADRASMKRLLLDIRDEARNEVRKEMRARGQKGKVQTPDYLEMVSAHAKPSSKVWQDLIGLLAMSRMLRQMGTVESTRELVYIYVRFDFMRIDTQLQLEKMGDRSVAALIEATAHPAKTVSQWAERRLDLRGRAIPSETVQVEDHAVLADILRAYGRIRDPDAARIIVSFANSERAQVREAARQGVAMLGSVGEWQLRDTYENIVGKKPPREWSWERTARELFTEFDRLRLSKVYRLFDEGKKARAAGELGRMKDRFDAVLARDPEFDHRDEMASGYVAYANERLDEGDRKKALDALLRAKNVRESEPSTKPIESLILTLDAEALLDRGLFDQVVVRRALDLDPQNTRAQALLDRMQGGDLESRSRKNRYLAAGVIGLLAVAGIVFVALRHPRKASEREQTPPAETST